jgi:DNA helicase-2/ATP-dependent DNA helicase PcrA
MEFEADYPNAVVVRLEENYRSTAPILTAAGNLIARNRQRKDKRLVATRQGGVDVKIVRLADERAEAAEVVETIRRLRGEGVNYSQMAIFYRVNALSRVLEDAIRRNSIPYQMARGVEFYNRAEIKDVLAYLKLMLNPADGLSCRRIINVPARGIGDVTIGKLEAAAKARKVSLLAACRDPAQAGLPAGVGAKVAAFAKLIDELRNFPAGNVKELLERVIERSGIEAALADDPKEKQAFENVGELVSSAAEFDKYHPEATLADYLYEVSLVSDVDTVDSQAGAVTLMTLHAAKGLEFPVVFIVGLERGLLPFVRANGDKTDLEEERRLLFVGVTRAKDRLMLTTAMHRTLRGVQTRQVESAFLAELGSQTVTRLDKAPMAEPVRRGPISLEEFNRSAARRHEDGFYEEVDGRAMVEAMEMADTLPSEFAGIRPGRRVHHPMFGQGKVVQVSGTGAQTRAVVEFDRHGRKILILQHAHLEPLDEF